jgi:hypothetical protein
MLAVGSDRDAAETLSGEHGLTLANENSPQQFVLSGPLARIEQAETAAKASGVRAKKLAVAGAFHTEAMSAGVEAYRAELDEIEFRSAAAPVVSSTTADFFGEDVRDTLAASLVNPIRWTAVLEKLRSLGVTRYLDVGPGKVLAGLVRRTVEGAEVESLSSRESALPELPPGQQWEVDSPSSIPMVWWPCHGAMTNGAKRTAGLESPPSRPRSPSAWSKTRRLPVRWESTRWISSRTGIHRRRRVDGETLVDLAADAGSRALFLAGLDPTELDLVLVATCTPDRLLPHAAPLVASRMGAEMAGALDVGAACTGFLSALSLATAQLESGRARAVLVVGAEVLSSVTDYSDRRTAGLFGDGAGAAVLTLGGPGLIGPDRAALRRARGDLIQASNEERLVRMDGRATFRQRSRR